MANICVLPNELLTPIIGHLRERKIDHFDSVATKDLQTMRLVCSKVRHRLSLSFGLAWPALTLELIHLAVFGDRYTYALRKHGPGSEVLAS